MKKIPVTAYIWIDDEDVERVAEHKWSFNRRGYALSQQRVNGGIETVYLAKFLMNCPEGKYIDHIDGDKLNNQKANLRICDHAENCRNIPKRTARKRNFSSRYKGVSLHRKTGKWAAAITKDKRKRHLGLFDTETEAAETYDRAAKTLFGEFSNLNF